MESKEEKAMPTEEGRNIFLTDYLGEMCGTTKFHDVVFVVGEEKERLPAHRLILAASSDIFEAMMYPAVFPDYKDVVKKGPIEIRVADVKPDVFKSLLQCVYTDEAIIDSENVADLIKVAKRYQIEKLQFLCSEFMTNDINMDNALDLFAIGPELLGDKEFGMTFIRDNLSDLVTQDKFFELKKDRFIAILEDNQIDIEELELFKVVLQWGKLEAKRTGVKESPDALKKILKDLIVHVRFPTMEMPELAGQVAASGVIPQDQLLELFKFVSMPESSRTKTDKLPFNIAPREGGLACKNSKLLDRKFKKDILSLFGTPAKPAKRVKLNLLYQGSRDGFTPSAFHSKSDSKVHTLTVIRTTTGNVFGGYFAGSWAGSGSYSTMNAWLFSLKNRHNKVVKLISTSTGNNAYSNASYGPTWGGGHDLHVNSNMKSMSNYCSPSSFQGIAPGFPSVTVDNTLLAGAYNWTVDDIEVFEILLPKL